MLHHLDVVAHGLRFYGALIGAVTTVCGLFGGAIALGLGEPLGLLIAPAFMAFGALIAAPFIATGRGLLDGRPWARTAGIVLSLLIITDLPIGMSLGILGLGVLLDEEVTAAFSGDGQTTGSVEVSVDRSRARMAARARAAQRVG